MKMQMVERLLTHAWYARTNGTATLIDKEICSIIDASLELLREIDSFFGTIYLIVIETVYFKGGDESLRKKEFALPLHERKVYDYRKRYTEYICLKLSL